MLLAPVRGDREQSVVRGMRVANDRVGAQARASSARQDDGALLHTLYSSALYRARLPGSENHSTVHATLEALQAGVGRGPAQQPSRLIVAGAQPLHLALLRAQALLVGHDFDLCAHDVGDHAGCIANRDLEAAAQINDYPDSVARSIYGITV